MVKLGWENFVDSLKNWAEGWENYDCSQKSWVDDWKNNWNDGSGLHGLIVGGHCFIGSMRNLGDFSNQDCTLVRKDHCTALKRPHSSVLKSVVKLETQDAPQIHDSLLDSKYSPELKISLD